MGILPNPQHPEQYKLEDVFKLIDRVSTLALEIGGGIAVIFLILGAYEYFMAFGNEERAQKGKNIILWTIVGIVVIILSKVIIEALKNILI